MNLEAQVLASYELDSPTIWGGVLRPTWRRTPESRRHPLVTGLKDSSQRTPSGLNFNTAPPPGTPLRAAAIMRAPNPVEPGSLTLEACFDPHKRIGARRSFQPTAIDQPRVFRERTILDRVGCKLV